MQTTQIELVNLSERTPDHATAMNWWYLSFAGEESWIGGIIVEANNSIVALQQAAAIIPDLGVQCLALIIRRPELPATDSLYKLLDQSEAERWLGRIVDFTALLKETIRDRGQCNCMHCKSKREDGLYGAN